MKSVKIRDTIIGNGAKIAIQSMLNVPTTDTGAAIDCILRLADEGCDIIRLAVPDAAAARAMKEITAASPIPVVADIHFDYRLALACIDNGVDKIRINPGNLGGADKAAAVAKAANAAKIPIRIGINGGSLEKGLLERCGGDLALAMVESAQGHIDILNRCDFNDIVLSMKSSDVKTTIRAYRLAHERFDYPLHLGVTEAGTTESGIVKSAIGIGALLADGIGDTIRVSLTDDPIEEVKAAKLILQSLDLYGDYVNIVSCPTCGRTKIDLISIANAVRREIGNLPVKLKVAVMGCVVNGPGEAREADLGVAGGCGEGLLFKKGKILRKMPEDQLLAALKDELDHWEEERI